MAAHNAFLRLPALVDGSIRLADLTEYAREYDDLDADATPALDFMEWVSTEMVAAAMKDAIDDELTIELRNARRLGAVGARRTAVAAR